MYYYVADPRDDLGGMDVARKVRCGLFFYCEV